jgi:chemotaxis protein histidine kinase CheA
VAAPPPGPPPTALAIDPELRDIFLAEGADLFERIESLVLGLSRGARAVEPLHELCRCLHTLKGAAGSVGLVQVAGMVHDLEEQIESARGEASDAVVDALHQALQYLDAVFLALRRGSAPPEAEAPPSAPVASRSAEPTPTPTARAESPPPAPDAPPGDGPVRVPSERIDELMDLASELLTRRNLWSAQNQTMKELARAARVCRNRLASTIDRLREAGASLEASASYRGPGRRSSDHEDMPGLLRRLAEQAEDLSVLSETAQSAASPLAENSDAIARTTLQLWDALQTVRIVSVRGLFQRLTRVAHDAARVEGRQITVETVGDETGLDRAVQDKAFEPLLHVVRNAVSHGIEAPAERTAAGKPSAGKVTLEASRAGNTLMLAVSDDGRGLDYAAIAAKGRRLGLIAPGDEPGVDRLNALIFQPGFSTREAANAIAGRGVGMDVVSQEVGRLHGSVELQSNPGKGTRLTLRLPARLSLQQATIFRVGGRAFALPVELVELAQPFDPDAVDHDGPVPRVTARGEWAPLVSAREALGFPPAGPGSCPKLLLIRADGGLLAVVVDAIEGTGEIVVKPLGPLLSGHPSVAGTSLSVTGELVLALNPSGLARWAGRRAAADSGGAEEQRSTSVLVVDDSISVRKVVARHLRGMGYDVEEVSDGLEALGRLRSRSYRLVVSDLEMPRMDGFELLAELARLEIAKTVPVLVASTRSDPETRRKVLALGAREFLTKPIDPDAMTALARELAPAARTTA